MALYQFEKQQIVHATIDEVWDFISSPQNLKEITPKYMRFEVTSINLPEKMYPGMLIAQKVRPMFGIPLLWLTEITQVVDKQFFIDEQRMGPYAFWHHQHFIESHVDCVLMTDIVSYKPPFGVLGRIANVLFIRKQLNEIFTFREKVLNEKFPKQK